MTRKNKRIVAAMLALKRRHGDLNTALVREYVKIYGLMSERALSQDIGLSRNAIRRALQGWSELDHYKS